jgi:hypothetical protein
VLFEYRLKKLQPVFGMEKVGKSHLLSEELFKEKWDGVCWIPLDVQEMIVRCLLSDFQRRSGNENLSISFDAILPLRRK